MAKRAIGINLNNDRIDIVQIAKHRDGYRLEMTHSVPLRRESDDPAKILQSLAAEKKFDRKAPVTLALPSSALSYRHIDQNKAEQRTEQSNANWLDEFPHDSDTIVTEGCAYQHLPNQQQTYLMAATDRNTMARHSEPIRHAGWNLQRLDAPLLAIHTLALTNHPDKTNQPAILLFADNDHLDILIFQQIEIITIRSLPWKGLSIEPSLKQAELLIRELEMSWRMTFNETIPPSTPIIATGSINTDTTILQSLEENLLADVIQLNHHSHLNISTDKSLPNDYLLAQGLALRGLTQESGQGMNFQNAQANIQNQNPTSLRKPALVSLALVCAIVLTAITGLLTQRYRLETHYQSLKTQIRTQFQESCPDETNIVNENAQLKTHLASLQKKSQQLNLNHKTISPLDVMALINENSPTTLGITIDQLRINEQTILIDAHANQPEQITTWQHQLKKIEEFHKIQRQDATNKVKGHFTLKIILTETTP